MFNFAILMVVVAGVVGLGVKYLTRNSRYYHIDWIEYAIALVAIGVLVAPSAYAVGNSLSVNKQLRYEEFYNGVETSADVAVNECRKGSTSSSFSARNTNCEHEYGCDWGYETSTDFEGNTTTDSFRVYCPHFTHELEYSIQNSLGQNNKFPGVFVDEKRTPWDANKAVPDDVSSGPPQDWLQSRKRLEAGDPRPVTGIFEYNNFILAPAEESYLPFADDIEELRSEGILPDHTQNIQGKPLYGPTGTLANKLSFVGVEAPGGEAEWQEALNSLNGALGMTLRGDVHMVVMDADLVESKVSYTNTLKAYWTGPDFDRRAIAKNSIIIVIGVEGDEAVWAEATTGMPYGNEVMLEAISGQIGRGDVPFTHEAIIGNPVLASAASDPEVILSDTPGVVEEIIFQQHPFARASMECTDGDDGESCLGFSHLVEKLDLSIGTRIVMAIFVIIGSGVLWWIAAVANPPWAKYVQTPQDGRRSRRYL